MLRRQPRCMSAFETCPYTVQPRLLENSTQPPLMCAANDPRLVGSIYVEGTLLAENFERRGLRSPFGRTLPFYSGGLTMLCTCLRIAPRGGSLTCLLLFRGGISLTTKGC